MESDRYPGKYLYSTEIKFTTEDTEDTEFYFIRRHGLPQYIFI